MNLSKFKAWIAERDAANDWQDYVRGNKLNRSEIAAECVFALSVLRQNPAVKAALEALESRLRAQGVISVEPAAPDASGEAAEASAMAADKRVMAAKARAEARVKDLEERNARLRAEVHELRERLAHYKHLDDHLGRTGRLLPP